MIEPRKPKNPHGSGSIKERPSGKYQAQIYLKGQRLTKTLPTKREAQKWIREQHKLSEDGNLPSKEGRRITVKEYLEHWLATAGPLMWVKTRCKYESMVRHHLIPDLGSIKLSELRADHLQRMYADKLTSGKATSTVNQLHGIIHRALADAVRWGFASRNVADQAKAPKVRRQPVTAWNPEEARAFLKATAQDHYYPLWLLALHTGLRCGELSALRWEDANLDTGCVLVRRHLQRIPNVGLVEGPPKSATGQRQVHVPVAVCGVLRRWRTQQKLERLRAGGTWQDGGYVFTTTKGVPVEEATAWYHFKRAVCMANLPAIRFHDLRHTAASLLLAEGVPPKVVQEMLGHSSIKQTMDTYGHLFPTSQNQAATIMGKLLAEE